MNKVLWHFKKEEYYATSTKWNPLNPNKVDYRGSTNKVQYCGSSKVKCLDTPIKVQYNLSKVQ